MAAGLERPEEARGNDAALVGDHTVALAQERRQIAEASGPPTSPAPRSTTRSREASRGSAGSCAISSGGKS